MSIIFGLEAKVLQDKLDKLGDRLKTVESTIAFMESEQRFHDKYAKLFSDFKNEFILRLKQSVAFELATMPNGPEHALPRERLAGKFEAYTDLQQYENGVETRLTNLLVEKAKILSEITELKEQLKKQTARQERKAINA